ncbi:fasciclin-like arabinogalactan protein 14 [Silene latifolia]|uniref:fasciclin-like arabinogalactan protein 14 n=1 Tax=Silene latifolia TaxID=37657 RepID=UPI003D76FAD9
MAPKASTTIILLLIMALYTTTVSAFNITRLLDQHPDFSTFNDLLTKSGLASDINKRQTITVLVIDNSGMGPISSRPDSTIKNIMATHALLDYYDINKISDMSKSGSIATNFFQNTGIAFKEQGQTRVSTTTAGEVVFSSAMKGSPRDSKMVRLVAAQPYNISVIQISQPIMTPGLDQTAPSVPSGSPKSAPPAFVLTPPPKEPEAPMAEADGPADDEDIGEVPEGEGPAAASVPSPTPAPEGEEADKETPAKEVPATKNGEAQLTASSAAAVVACVMVLVALYF